MESTDFLRKVISFWVEYHFSAFADCAAERRHLNNIENENGLDEPSVLGEVEVLTGTIMGVARSCLSRNGVKKPYERIALLETNTIYRQENLIKWMINQGSDFPSFLRYLMVIENLRLSTVEYLRASTESG